MVSPVINMRPEVEKFFHVIDLPLPDDEELFNLQSELGKVHNIKVNKKAARAAKGLTEFEAETAYALSLIRKGYFSTKVISEAKSQMIRKSGLMEFWEPADIADVGGLNSFKAFIANRSKAFSPENTQSATNKRNPVSRHPRHWKESRLESDCINTWLATDTSGYWFSEEFTCGRIGKTDERGHQIDRRFWKGSRLDR